MSEDKDQQLVTPYELERLRSDALEVSDHETAALVMRAMSRGDLEAMARCEALVQTMRPLWAAIDDGEQTRALHRQSGFGVGRSHFGCVVGQITRSKTVPAEAR